jgi:outer membrane protein assembly complex protein YaeT
MRLSSRGRRAALCALVSAVSVLCVSGCKETGTVQVSSLTFTGNHGVAEATLKGVIATQQNGFLPFSRKHYFDRPEFDRDVKRIEAYYADHGYPNAKVSGLDVQLNGAKDKVAIKVTITEGAPVIVESVTLEGLDVIPAPRLERLKAQLPFVVGQPRNQTTIIAGHDMVVGELRDHGFPYGTVRVVERPGSAADRVQLAVVADRGPSAVFGPITVTGNSSVGDDVIRRELQIHEGQRYRLSNITESQRRLYALELFQFANITPRLPDDRSVSVPVVVTVAEGKHRKLQMALGYGSEEKARARVSWRHVNFGGGARTMDTEAKWSSLEHGVRGTFTEPYLFKSGLSLKLSGSSWWSAEPSYTDRSSGGRAILTKDFGRGATGLDRGTHNELRVSIIDEYESYSISASALNDPTLRDQFIALGLDPTTGKGSGRLSALEIDYDRNTAGQPLDPRRGYVLSSHIETADNWLGGSFRYNEFVGEGRKYFQLGNHLVWASRFKGGTLQGTDSAKIPFFKRYFVGGSTSVRGWGRYQVSPLSDAGLPIGGRTMAEVSTEARFLVRGRLSGVAFVDGGNVWADPWKFGPGGLRWAVGPGLRYNTPIGPLRVDFGKQLNPIPGLVLNGDPEKRKWRVHFSIGQAF